MFPESVHRVIYMLEEGADPWSPEVFRVLRNFPSGSTSRKVRGDNITLHYTSLTYTIPHYITITYTKPHNTILTYTIPHYTTLTYTTPHYTTITYTIPHYTIDCTILYYTDMAGGRSGGDETLAYRSLHNISRMCW